MTPPTGTTPPPTPDVVGSSNDPTASLYSLIAEQPFFKGLSPHQLQLLADSAMEMKFEPAQQIFEAGSPANRFYLILEGRVVLESELAEPGVMLPVQTLGPGDNLGWSWLFPPYLVHLSARAMTPTRTIFFYGTRLREQCELDHELGYELMKRIAEVATECLRVTQQRLLESVDAKKVQGKLSANLLESV
jgi:CRP-like cAMP-binding protein